MASPTRSTPKRQKSSLRDVTNEVTKEKLTLLENQRVVMKAHYAAVLEKYEKEENKASLKFLKEVHETLVKCPNGDNPVKDTTDDLAVFLNCMNTETDEDVIYFGTWDLVKDKIEELITCIKNQIEKCEYSCIYAQAMTQYMDSNENVVPEVDDGVGSGDSKSASNVNKKETIDEFIQRVFSKPAPEGFSKEAFEELLETKLFNMNDPAQKKQILDIRSSTKRYCKNWSENNHMGNTEVQQCIDSLIREDLLGKEKGITLKELRENDSALTEVAALLNKRLQNYREWQWKGPILVNFRRNIAGRYRAYMDEDILTAIFLHFIGAKWSIYFKSCFEEIYNSKLWKRGTGTTGDLYYRNDSIEAYRRSFHKKSFLSVLPDKMEDLAAATTIYDDENGSRHRRRRKDDKLTPMEIKQQLLHLISNEIHLNNALRPGTPLTVVQTDMEWFGPSLIHEAVLALFKYFGVSDEWLQFFKKFLETPMKIESVSAPVQIRKRGSPISHQLTTLFGESLLFVMDLYVNLESGLSIHRIHDDFWFWGHNTENVIKAWNAMQNFTKLAGLKQNEDKMASISCQSDSKPNSITFGPAPLPQKNVQWGFIVLHSDGIFRISDELLAPHIKEMEESLKNVDNVMSWIHAHNRYIRFFIRNFAEPAQTFRKQHIVQIMEKLKNILKQVHRATNGDAVEALKLRFGEVLKGKDVMDAWVYWAVKDGGLALFNPFLQLVPLHEAYRKKEKEEEVFGFNNPWFGTVFNSDKIQWDTALENSKRRRKQRAQFVTHTEQELVEETLSDEEVYGPKLNKNEDYQYAGLLSDDDEDEGTHQRMRNKIKKRTKRVDFETRCQRYRETRWSQWKNHYCSLLTNLDPVDCNEGVDWKESMYNHQMEAKLGYGADEFVDSGLVPLTLINSMQSARVHND